MQGQNPQDMDFVPDVSLKNRVLAFEDSCLFQVDGRL